MPLVDTGNLKELWQLGCVWCGDQALTRATRHARYVNLLQQNRVTLLCKQGSLGYNRPAFLRTALEVML